VVQRGVTSTHPRTERRGEPRLPAALAVLAAIALYTLLPESLLLGPRLVIPSLGVLLLVALVAVNPKRLTRQTRLSRIASLVLVGLIGLANMVALFMLLRALLESHVQDGRALLVAALQVWLTNIIVFGLAFWELDRGGPVTRTQRPRAELPPADFRFSQDENDDAISEVAAGSSKKSGWVPALHDYLYVSLTNSTAFSPTDTMPLTGRAKLLMGVECSSALIISVLVIARGVGILQ
jgi:uncharacterized membrane protein